MGRNDGPEIEHDPTWGADDDRVFRGIVSPTGPLQIDPETGGVIPSLPPQEPTLDEEHNWADNPATWDEN